MWTTKKQAENALIGRHELIGKICALRRPEKRPKEDWQVIKQMTRP